MPPRTQAYSPRGMRAILCRLVTRLGLLLLLSFASTRVHAAVVAKNYEMPRELEADATEMSHLPHEVEPPDNQNEEEASSGEYRKEEIQAEHGEVGSVEPVLIPANWAPFIRALRRVFKNKHQFLLAIHPSKPDKPYVVFL